MLQIKTNPDNATENILQCEILLFFPLPYGQLCASVLPYLGIILSAFSLNNSKLFFKKVRTVAVQGISIKTYVTVSTSNFLTHPPLTPAHSFLYVHTRFRTFRIATRPN